jgi:hypothetical protein
MRRFVVPKGEMYAGRESNAGFEYFNPSLQSLRELLAIQRQIYLMQDFPGGGGGVGVGGSGAGGFVICFIICDEADKSVSHVKLF